MWTLLLSIEQFNVNIVIEPWACDCERVTYDQWWWQWNGWWTEGTIFKIESNFDNDDNDDDGDGDDGDCDDNDVFFQERKIEINKMKTLLSQVSSKDIDKQTESKTNKIS